MQKRGATRTILDNDINNDYKELWVRLFDNIFKLNSFWVKTVVVLEEWNMPRYLQVYLNFMSYTQGFQLKWSFSCLIIFVNFFHANQAIKL